MGTKLTLNIDKQVIDEAKEYAKTQKISLSKLVETYLTHITNKQTTTIPISQTVKELGGVIKIDEDIDFKKDYSDYLIDKYK